jgi:hypothetical protein
MGWRVALAVQFAYIKDQEQLAANALSACTRTTALLKITPLSSSQ